MPYWRYCQYQKRCSPLEEITPSGRARPVTLISYFCPYTAARCVGVAQSLADLRAGRIHHNQRLSAAPFLSSGLHARFFSRVQCFYQICQPVDRLYEFVHIKRVAGDPIITRRTDRIRRSYGRHACRATVSSQWYAYGVAIFRYQGHFSNLALFVHPALLDHSRDSLLQVIAPAPA